MGRGQCPLRLIHSNLLFLLCHAPNPAPRCVFVRVLTSRTGPEVGRVDETPVHQRREAHPEAVARGRGLQLDRVAPGEGAGRLAEGHAAGHEAQSGLLWGEAAADELREAHGPVAKANACAGRAQGRACAGMGREGGKAGGSVTGGDDGVGRSCKKINTLAQNVWAVSADLRWSRTQNRRREPRCRPRTPGPPQGRRTGSPSPGNGRKARDKSNSKLKTATKGPSHTHCATSRVQQAAATAVA